MLLIHGLIEAGGTGSRVSVRVDHARTMTRLRRRLRQGGEDRRRRIDRDSWWAVRASWC